MCELFILSCRVLHSGNLRTMHYFSMLNWMLYFRGHTQDFDEWEDKLGNPGWGWRDVLPFFRKAERFAGANEGGDVYGTEGSYRIMFIPYLYKVRHIIRWMISHITSI